MPVAVDIVLPCFNPNDKWHHELLDFHKEAKDRFSFNYIIVNDGSDKGKISEQIDMLKDSKISLDFISYEKNMGKGFALRRGVAVAMADFIIFTDIDFPFTNRSTLDLIDTLTSKKADVVTGYREQNYYSNKMSVFRRLLSRGFRFFIKQIVKMSVTDTQCGLKGFNRKGRDIFLKTTINRYLFDFEFIYMVCRTDNVSIVTVPAQLKENVTFSKMKVRILFQEMLNLYSVLFYRRGK